MTDTTRLASRALVTGASSGTGAASSERLAREGYDLLLVARNAERLNILKDRLEAEYGNSTEILAADLTDAGDLLRVEERARADPRLHFLVNNAGFVLMGRVAEL